ncbi:MAG: universal stress protein [Myxococcota bacterium]
MDKPFLVAVDFSELTGPTLERAATLAKGSGNRIDLVHVVPPQNMTSRGNMAAKAIAGQVAKNAEEHARRKLAPYLEQIPVAHRGEAIVKTGMAAELLCEVAGQGYEMMVLATNGRTGLSHALLGSVAERVVRLCPIPVLVVR